MKEEIIESVHDQNLDEVLKKLGLLEKIQQGLLRCGICDKVVNRDSLQGIYKDGENTKVVCDDPFCFKEVIKKIP